MVPRGCPVGCNLRVLACVPRARRVSSFDDWSTVYIERRLAFSINRDQHSVWLYLHGITWYPVGQDWLGLKAHLQPPTMLALEAQIVYVPDLEPW